MPKITVYANYEFINDSDNCYDNGELSIKDKKKKYFKNYYSENRDKIIENNSINQKKKAGKI